ncbi:unnamed protein product [Blepharisma stoltei]|uniref:Protein phosphatase n=1 Tax=Blepharisma stoltei TaxID=1481888 RepID=A0AAU9JIR6_9CILI|nr:unnamed protein product [Blepharisma stoltei]
MLTKLIRNFSQLKNYFKSAQHGVPGPEKINKLGEDAYFTSPEIISIADGVGGWTTIGIDPSKYSWELMNNVGKAFEALPEPQKYNARDILVEAAKNSKEIGSSTCALAILDKDEPKLYTANIGDSGFIIYRKKDENITLVAKSKEVTHDFNFPFQLGTNGDDPNKASFETFEVQDKDIIIMYTDGVGDNLHEEQITGIVSLSMNAEVNLKEIAEKLVKLAYEQSNNRMFKSPFMINAMKARMIWYGGKPDDITVVCGEVNLKSNE